ncbi:MAG TPA: PAS domain S-box protein [Methanobacteriales archaeon]|nr:MAG: Putative PAS/PAC sensor protein [Methanobacteriaceae archaeon 41_258]MBC7089937.1 PAS domain S-box protein [Methanobacteriaceae archaeon]MBC7097077.1 PAS domain S-box protein [Methanobacteriales archaeon]HIH61785.1 PAS domain S-box protein [Methanobacteriales archaeon]
MESPNREDIFFRYSKGANLIVKDSIIEEYNREFIELLGLPEDKLEGLSLGDIMDTRPLGKFVEDLHTNLKVDGSIIPVLVTCVPLGDGRSFLSMKISERLLAGFKSVFESTVDAILIVDEDGKILEANPAFSKVFGYERDEIIGHELTLIIPSEFHEDFKEMMDKFKREGEHPLAGRIFETKSQRADGSIISVEMSLTPWTFNGKNYTTSIIRDITQRKKMEEKLRASEEKYRRIVEKFIQNALALIAEIKK